MKYPWIAHNIELEEELGKTREECKDCKLNIKGLERKLSEADFEIMRLEGAS